MKRFKKILKWTGIVLGALLAIGLVANALFVWITDARLERQLAAIRASGDPLTLAELARPPMPPEQNAATYLRRAEAEVAAMEKETARVQEALQHPGSTPSPDEQKIVKAAFAAYPNAIPLLEQAAACPDYDAELDYTPPSQEFLTRLLDVVQKPRAAARVLRLRGALLIAEKDRDGAVRVALTIFRLARHLDRNPMLVAYLSAMALRSYAIRTADEALQAGPVSKDVRDALEQELAIQERMEGFAWTLKSEQCYAMGSFGDIIPMRNFWLVGRGMWNRQESACLEMFPKFIALASVPGASREIDQMLQGDQPVMAALLFPAFKAAFQAVDRMRAEIRALRVLNALQTHVPAGSKELPKLTSLGLPAETILDPFSGEPLHVKQTPQGWLVYSVGLNGRDDGGNLDAHADGDVGVGPPPPPAKK